MAQKITKTKKGGLRPKKGKNAKGSKPKVR